MHLRSPPVNHKIRSRDIAAKPASQEARYTGNFRGKTGAFEANVCVLGLLCGYCVSRRSMARRD